MTERKRIEAPALPERSVLRNLSPEDQRRASLLLHQLARLLQRKKWEMPTLVEPKVDGDSNQEHAGDDGSAPS